MDSPASLQRGEVVAQGAAGRVERGRVGVGAAEAAWLRTVLLADGVVQDEERKFLHELRGEAGQSSPEFEALFAEAMAMPQERRTSR